MEPQGITVALQIIDWQAVTGMSGLLIALSGLILSQILRKQQRMAQKYSLLNEYRNEVISFSRIFFEIVSDAIALRIRADAPNMETEEIDKIASRLSSLVDTGRFLFPNDISHANAFGFEKGPAYAGRRRPPLDAIPAACYAVQAMKSSNKKYMRVSLLELQKGLIYIRDPLTWVS